MPQLALPLLYAVAGILFLLEHWHPAHPLKPSARWYLSAVMVNALQLAVFISVDASWTAYAGSWSIVSLAESLSAPAGACLAYFVFTFCVYWWHRLRHHSPLIWRLFHQLHHSPERIQTLTAYYIHPFDMIANLIISNSIIYLLLGLSLEAAGWYTLITGAAGFFIHANIRVPKSIGYVFQTPEMHRLHHKSGHHAHNYSDIVWWDMLFGTYSNPQHDIESCGFSKSKEEDIFPMLVGKDLFITKEQ